MGKLKVFHLIAAAAAHGDHMVDVCREGIFQRGAANAGDV
jgi:hypothetical protein